MLKKSRNFCAILAVGMLCAALAWVGGCSKAIRTYDGQAKPLQEVAIISTAPETCPITRIDGETVGREYEAGNEYHLLPGKHIVQVVDPSQDCIGYCKIEFVDLEYDFLAGHIYSIPQMTKAEAPQDNKNSRADEKQPIQAFDLKIDSNDNTRVEVVDLGFGFQAGNAYPAPLRNQLIASEGTKQNKWTPNLVDQGEVVVFAAQNPNYFKYSSDWSKLRKENGLTPSIFERLNLPKLAFNWFKSTPTDVAQDKPIEKF